MGDDPDDLPPRSSDDTGAPDSLLVHFAPLGAELPSQLQDQGQVSANLET